MANKSFVVQYLIKARDHYSKAAEKTRKATAGMTSALKKAKAASAAVSAESETLKNRIKSAVPEMSGLRRASGALSTSLGRVKAMAAAIGLPKVSASALTLKNRISSLIPTMGMLTTMGDRVKASMEAVEKRFKGITFVGEKLRNTGAILSATVTLPALMAVKSLKDAARDAVETRSKFATVFRDIGHQAQKTADQLAKGYGLTGTMARQLIGDTGDLLTGFGFTQKASLELSNQVNKLAVDLASFTNYEGGAEGASEALTKALLGEREQLKMLGVAILEKDVKAKIAQMSAKGHRFASLRQAQAEATLAIAIEQSKNAIGDFARTQEDLANQERTTSARIQDMKEAFGRVLLPIALKVTIAIRKMAEFMTALSPSTKKIILVVGGLLAVLGPLLLVIGAVILALPALMAGFAAMAPIIAAVTGPIAILSALLAAAAVLVINNWDSVKTFFSGFAAGISSSLGPTITHLIDGFKKAAKAVAELFGSDSEAFNALSDFSNLGELIGEVIGGALDTILRGIAGLGSILGQVIGSITTLDFSQFDVDAIKAEFLGAKAEPLLAQTRVDVGLNVGLDKGLTQTGTAQVSGPAARRTDVGVMQP